MREEFAADWCALHEVPAALPNTISMTDPPLPAEMHELFARYADQNPIASYFLRTRDGRATRFSDLMTRGELHKLEIYQLIYRPLGIDYQIAMMLPSGAERILGLVLSRRKRDFSDRERAELNLARPYLIQIYRNALATTRSPPRRPAGIPLETLQDLGLTRRQSQILGLLATGSTTTEAASELGISPRTAQKHLEHCYRTLGVDNRTHACRIAWSAAAAQNSSWE
jgi:DNA-binding CsgD family transcriptional regulator